MTRALPMLLLLCACGDPGGDYPALLPRDRLLAEPHIPGHADIAATAPDQVVEDLTAAGASLSVSQTRLAGAPVADEEGLARRGDDLRRRADRLRAEGVIDRDALRDQAADLSRRSDTLRQQGP